MDYSLIPPPLREVLILSSETRFSLGFSLGGGGVFSFYLKILNPDNFSFLDQVGMSANIPPPLAFFLQMFGPCGPKHIIYGQYYFPIN